MLRRLSMAAFSLAALAACVRAPERHDGPPARLVAGTGDTLVVNEYLGARLPVRVEDRDGQTLTTAGLRYRWKSGDSVPVSALGIVLCNRPGDATIRASIGALSQSFHLLCRPVHKLLTSWMLELVAGDSAHEIEVQALGLDGRPVAPLVGKVVVDDSTVAMISGLRVRPLKPGETAIHVRIGNYSSGALLTVAERVRSLERLRPEQLDVAMPVRLAAGEQRRWRVAAGSYMLWFVVDRPAEPIPRLAIEGAQCEAIFGGNRLLCHSPTSFSVLASAPAAEASGDLALRRLETPLRVWHR